GRDVHATQRVAAAQARARVRRRVELGALGEVARGQLRLRAREPPGAAGVERPAEGVAADEPAGGRGAERAPRPRHPAPGGLRADVGRGEGLLRLERRRRLRLDLTTPTLLAPPLAWLGVFFVVPIAI